MNTTLTTTEINSGYTTTQEITTTKPFLSNTTYNDDIYIPSSPDEGLLNAFSLIFALAFTIFIFIKAFKRTFQNPREFHCDRCLVGFLTLLIFSVLYLSMSCLMGIAPEFAYRSVEI